MKPKFLLSACLSFATFCATTLCVPPAFAQTGPPTITGISAAVNLPDQTLTITGDNFDWSISAPDINDSVTLNGLACPVMSWSVNQITVSLPKDAASGTIMVHADNGPSNEYPVTVGPRGIDILSGSGAVRPMLGASLYAGPDPSGSAVAIADTPDGMGYWTLSAKGTLEAYGDAQKLEPSTALSASAVGLAMNPTGHGGWILSQNGTVTPIGNASALGSASGAAVGIAGAQQGSGYWLLEQNGTIQGEGDVAGSWNGPSSPTAIAAAPGGGFWVLTASGQVAAFDGAKPFGNIASIVSDAHVTPSAIAATPDGKGYYILTRQGYLYGFGDALVPNPQPPLPSNAEPSVALAVQGPYQPYGLNNFVYWYPTGSMSQYLQYQSTMGSADNYISPHWFWVNSDGSVGGPSSDIRQQVAQMQSHGLKVVPMFGRSFGGSLGPLASPSSQTTMVKGIVADVNQWHLNGVNIDFEGLPNGSSGYLDTFVQKLKAALGPSKMLSVDVYPDWAPYTSSTGTSQPGYADTIYDYQSLTNNAYIVIMAYPMSYGPGPLSSLVKDSAIIQYVLHGITGSGAQEANPNHVFFGIPGYGQSWLGDTAYGLEADVTVPEINQMVASSGAAPQYNATRGETTVTTKTPLTPPPSTLDSGDTGPNVVRLQYALNAVLANPGQFSATSTNAPLPSSFPLTTDGDFSTSTVQAVYAFQQDWNVTGDANGVYGANTASKMSWVASNTNAFANITIPTYTWWEDAQGNVAHAKQSAAAGLAGVALWSMGEADPNYFSAMASGVNLAANGMLGVTLSSPTLYSGVSQTEIVTVTQGHGFPIANLTVGLMGQTATTDGNGEATFTLTPGSPGTSPIVVTDPSGSTVAQSSVTVSAASVVRQYGADRFGTATALGNSLYSQTQTVILTTAGNYPDALAGAPLATKLHAPILITMSDSLTPSTLAQIRQYGATQVILLGGPAAISDSVAQTLQQDGFSITRYAGNTRFGTAAQIAAAVGSPSGTAVLASGSSYPDALSIAPIAAQNQWPLLLTGDTGNLATLSPSTVQALKTLNIHQVDLIGSVNSIPDAIMSQLQQLGISSTRISGGTDFYGTNLAVIQHFASQLNPNHVVVATGQNFPDALASGPVAAALKAPLLLVPGLGSLSPDESAWLHSESGQIGNVIIAGGPAAVSTSVESQIASTLP